MSVRPFSMEFYLPHATCADHVAELLDRVEAHTVDARSLRDPAEERPALAETNGVHPAVVKVALSAVAWFLAVAWLDFSGGAEVDPSLAVVTGFFVMFLTLFLVTASMVVNDARWQPLKASFRKCSTIAFRSTGRDARRMSSSIAMLPVSFAIAGTLIGLVRSVADAGS